MTFVTSLNQDQIQRALQAVPADRVKAEILRREAERLSGSLRAFVEAAWEIIEPGVAFIPGMHIDAICEHLEALSKGQIPKLLVNVPPRHSKSVIFSAMFPAWEWTRVPTHRYLYASYSMGLSQDESMRCRRIIESDWFQARWGGRFQLSDDENLKTKFSNDKTGKREAISVGGVTTGKGGNRLFLDDPHNVNEAESTTVREGTVTWFREAWGTRASTKDTAMAVIMQRVHSRDVSGYCLEEGGWEHLCLPAEYEGAKVFTRIGWCDPRTEHGELLWPGRYGADELQALKTRLGPAASGQLQQRPVPRGGGIFKHEWVRYWYPVDGDVPPVQTVQLKDGTWFDIPQEPLPVMDAASGVGSWDLAFKGEAKNDFVVGQVWARSRRGGRLCLMSQYRAKADFVATLSAVRACVAENPGAMMLVEEKANGAAVIASLKQEIAGIVPIIPDGGKEARAHAVAPLWESGSVWLPHPAVFPWVHEFVAELTTFPKAAHDDQVDAMTQALRRMHSTARTETFDPLTVNTFGWRQNPWSMG